MHKITVQILISIKAFWKTKLPKSFSKMKVGSNPDPPSVPDAILHLFLIPTCSNLVPLSDALVATGVRG